MEGGEQEEEKEQMGKWEHNKPVWYQRDRLWCLRAAASIWGSWRDVCHTKSQQQNVTCNIHELQQIVVCPAEGRERSRRSAGNTKMRKTCSQQKVTRIKRFWSKHFRPRNKTIFTEFDRKKSRLSSVNIILFLCLKAFTSQACYVPAFLLGTSLANLCAPWGRRVLVHALLTGTQRNGNFKLSLN